MSDGDKTREELLRELEELRERERLYRTYIEKGPQAILVASSDGRFVHVNPAATRLTGYSREELLQLTIRDLSAPEAYAAQAERFARLLRDGAMQAEPLMRRKDGTIIVSSLDAVRIDDDRYMAFVSDITERKAQEAALRHERDRAQRYLDTVEALIVVLDTEGRITLLNRKGCRLLGYQESELLGRRWFEVCLPQPEGLEVVYPLFRRVMNGEALVEYVHNPVITRDGHLREIAWHNTLLRDDDGKIVGTLSAGDDITERKRLEQQVQQGQKMEALGTLAGGIAHDMNNVLAVVLGFGVLVENQLDPGHSARPALRSILDAANRGKALVENLLGFAHKGQYEKQPLQLNAIIDKLASVLRQSIPKKVVLRTELDPKLGIVRGDDAQLTQTLMNLCINAVDAVGGAGTITITTRDQRLGSGEIPELFAGRYIRIDIRDDGMGMTEEVRERALEPFFTTKGVGKGTGLGLSMAYGVVTNHHGSLMIDSTPGEGTTVTLWFPLADTASLEVESAAPESTPAPAPEPSAATGTILVVDDEQLVRTVVCKLLEALGHTAIPAEGGRAAIELFRQRRSEIDLVLLDLSMPDMDGSESFFALQAIDPDVKVLLCTGHGEESATTELRERGALGLVRKPMSLENLGRAVSDALG